MTVILRNIWANFRKIYVRNPISFITEYPWLSKSCRAFHFGQLHGPMGNSNEFEFFIIECIHEHHLYNICFEHQPLNLIPPKLSPSIHFETHYISQHRRSLNFANNTQEFNFNFKSACIEISIFRSSRNGLCDTLHVPSEWNSKSKKKK